jgi:hypothetical protein
MKKKEQKKEKTVQKSMGKAVAECYRKVARGRHKEIVSDKPALCTCILYSE